MDVLKALRLMSIGAGTPDGKYIAYTGPRLPEIAAAELRVIDLQGKLLVSKLIEPVTPGGAISAYGG